MPVDKFGHTDTGVSQRVIAGGVTLSQVNATFLRMDGTNAATGNLDMNGHCIEGLPLTINETTRADKAVSLAQAIDLITNHATSPSGDNHLANKKYVDEQCAFKVSKTGDFMTGNLILSIGGDRLRTMGCRNLSGNKVFDIFLGSTANKIHCWSQHPITLETTDGFLCKRGLENLIRIGISSTDLRTALYRDLVMNEHYIVDLQDPVHAQDAATKKYVDNSLKKCHVGYIPNLRSNLNCTGFIASASSNTIGHEAYHAFNHSTEGNTAWIAGDGVTAWLQIRCPEPVIIWRIALMPNQQIPAWNLSASNDGSTFTSLFTSTTRLQLSLLGAPFFDISTTTAYQYYRLTIPEIDDGLLTGIRLMQLYVYDT